MLRNALKTFKLIVSFLLKVSYRLFNLIVKVHFLICVSYKSFIFSHLNIKQFLGSSFVVALCLCTMFLSLISKLNILQLI